MKCPQCQVEAKPVGNFWICPTHGQLPEVWFDKDEIKFGNESRRWITDGILKSHRVLSFLSKHSTRDPGVCRDEIAIATNRSSRRESALTCVRRRMSELTSASTRSRRSEQELQPSGNIRHIQWLDMHSPSYLLANPLRSVINDGPERYLIVIDALDEAGEAGRNPLVEMLARNAQRLPDWLGLVVTSRPEFDVKTPLQSLNPFPLDTPPESNRADIRDFLRHELATQLQNRPDADRLVEQIVEKSEGVFLYIERFLGITPRFHSAMI